MLELAKTVEKEKMNQSGDSLCEKASESLKKTVLQLVQLRNLKEMGNPQWNLHRSFIEFGLFDFVQTSDSNQE
ncbi:hypothetical protein RvY_10400 [Ramazzottius varieornatus]|uniref:Uncharacterized protein n=1 Tax=Ramazzottius varieornatus TaxID=947166 RepID=A0A1D1VCM2_RAMVA|nr:hypothetical protein RvY_10400 [Ramazzottius varieornatus]